MKINKSKNWIALSVIALFPIVISCGLSQNSGESFDRHLVTENIIEALNLEYDNKIDLSDSKNRTLFNKYISIPEKLFNKFNEEKQNTNSLISKSEAAMFYYAAFFDSGAPKTEAEKEAASKKAMQEAIELISKTEEQKTNSSPGFSKAPIVRKILNRLTYLTQALKVESQLNVFYTDVNKKEEIKQVIKSILDDISKNYYFRNQQQYVNWWDYEIGIPKELLKNILVIKDFYDDEDIKKWIDAIDYFVPDALYGGAAPTAILNYVPVKNKRIQTGANLVENAKITIITAALSGDKEKIEKSLNYIYEYLLKDYVNKGDGFYKDGSFIQHAHLAYVGSYGEVLFSAMAEIAKYFANTNMDIMKDFRFENIYRFTELSIMPFMFKGSISDGLNGRSINRVNHGDKQKGLNILGALSVFAKNAPAKYKTRLENFIIEQVKDLDLENLSKMYRINSKIVKNLLAYQNSSLKIENPRNESWGFQNSEYPNYSGIDLVKQQGNMIVTNSQNRFSLKTNDLMFSINSHNDKTFKTEAMLGENLLSYYHGDSSTLLHTKNNPNPYYLNYWVTVNPFRISGTTSIEEYDWESNDFTQNEWEDNKKEIEKITSTLFKNSLSKGAIYNKIGVYASKIGNYNNKLETSKMQIIVDNKIFVLGVTSKTGYEINTTIENRMSKNINNTFETTKINHLSNNFKQIEEINLFDKDTKENNKYYVLKNNSKIEEKTYTKKPFFVNQNRKSENEITNTYNEITINHSTDPSFSYFISPNSLDSKQDIEMINKFNIISQSQDLLISSYKKDGKETYFIAYFGNNEQIDKNIIPILNEDISLNEPTLMIISQDASGLKIIKEKI